MSEENFDYLAAALRDARDVVEDELLDQKYGRHRVIDTKTDDFGKIVVVVSCTCGRVSEMALIEMMRRPVCATCNRR